MVEVAVLVASQLATSGSSGCIGRLGAAVGTREKRPITSDPTERPCLWSQARANLTNFAASDHADHAGPAWLEVSATRWARQREEPYALPEPGATWDEAGAAAAAAAAAPEAAMARALDCIALIPTSLDVTERLKAAIKFVVPAQRRARALELLAKIDAVLAEQGSPTRVFDEITELVGKEELRRVMAALGLDRGDA